MQKFRDEMGIKAAKSDRLEKKARPARQAVPIKRLR
jgi:hypothetical protein